MIWMPRFENWRRNKAWIQSRSSEADYLIGERSILASLETNQTVGSFREMQAERETGKRLERRDFHHPLSYRATPVRVQKSPQQLLWTRKRQIAVEVMLAGLH